MKVKHVQNVLIRVSSCGVILAMSFGGVQASPYQISEPPAQAQKLAPDQPQAARLSPERLQELVAPIALYPDALVAQILAASDYPTQIVEAQRFLQQNSNLKGASLGAQVDKQDWDPSVKALTQFPSVLADMDKNISWTSELGDVNLNQQTDVMAAVQVLRQKAQKAGNLKSTPQQTVTDQGNDVVIQPTDPQVVYVPDYDPEFVYGYPMDVWPGFDPWWGVYGPYMSFGLGFGVGPFFGFGWGWNSWGMGWGGRGLLYGGGRYGFHSHAFYDRNAFNHGGFRGSPGFARGDRGMRGFSQGAERSGGPSLRSGGSSGARSGAFGGFGHGGDTRGFSSRGQSSMGGMRGGGMRGSGGMRGGGGGMRGGGGGHGGGGHR